jgi:Mrp family chromosome partitioning ATPase
VVSLERNPSLQPFYEALRDRLLVHFEVKNLTHKPKLVAVTSAGQGAGVSTIAAGLAASLSRTGDGNVLLVDMNLEHGAAQQFYKGKPDCGLDAALENATKGNALVQENLYVVTGNSDSDKLPRILPKRFAALLPRLKASDYDYIIFDLPPVSQTSITSRLARLMDMVLLVVESEKSNREVVQQASTWLAESGATVGAVLNKTRRYVPERLHPEFLSDK